MSMIIRYQNHKGDEPTVVETQEELDLALEFFNKALDEGNMAFARETLEQKKGVQIFKGELERVDQFAEVVIIAPHAGG